MKVNYVQCDLCGRKIEGGYQYEYKSITRSIEADSCETERLDVCRNCMDSFREWIRSGIKKKEAKDGPST